MEQVDVTNNRTDRSLAETLVSVTDALSNSSNIDLATAIPAIRFLSKSETVKHAVIN
jgi:hypothetical protein